MDMAHGLGYWDHEHHRVKYEGCNSNDDLNRNSKDERGVYQCCDTNLNFSTAICSEDDSEYGSYKKNKVTRQDPMSHRIIEKRRRDRMNNCLADLSRLIPTEYLKKGRGRIEKTEIIEMAIKHMKYLQQEHGNQSEHYRMGYQECMSETMRFMVEVEGHFPREGVCLRILNHLQKHCENLTRIPRAAAATNGNVATAAAPSVTSAAPTVQLPDYQTHSKEQNNNNSCPLFPADETIASGNNNESGIVLLNEENGCGEKHHHECNGNGAVSYKYKTNIKMRFSQDLNDTGVVSNKRQKVEFNGRRASVTSVDNHSSSHSSPPSSETMTRISEQETASRVSPTESTTSSTLHHLKMEPHHHLQQPNPHPYTIASKTGPDKNFTVPIFVLHAKGAYYIPLTIDYKSLVPFLRNYDIVEVDPAMHNNVILHPVNINVNFQPTKYNHWN